MKNILVIDGSTRPKGNTSKLVQAFTDLGVNVYHDKVTTVYLRKLQKDLDLKHCIHCSYCHKHSKCVHKDYIGDILANLQEYDCIVIANPVYFFTWNSLTKTFIDRLYSTNLEGVKLASICVSGSEGYEGGADILLDQYQRIAHYCGAEFMGMFHKVTNDEILEVTQDDIFNLEELLIRIQGCESSSNFIRGL